MKECSKCGETKPHSEYYKRSDTKSGYHAQCKKCVKAKVSENYFANPEPAKQKSKIWRKQNPERNKLSNKIWRENNKDYLVIQNNQWRKNNYHKHLENSRKWSTNNKLRRRENELRRRARKYNNGVYQITIKELTKLKNQNCYYCNKSASITFDHIIPIARGGRHSIGNLAPACQSCNSSKGAKTITEWKMAKRKAASNLQLTASRLTY